MAIYKNPNLDLYNAITWMSNKLCKTREEIWEKQSEYLERTKKFSYMGKYRA
jgi:hypothetical protein